MLLSYLAVGLGGGLGAIARFSLSKILPSTLIGMPFPILCINVLGCFAMGVLAELMTSWWLSSENMRYFLASGFLGGFTTFSAFTLEFGLLYQKQLYGAAVLYALLSFFLSIMGFFIGSKIARLFL